MTDIIKTELVFIWERILKYFYDLSQMELMASKLTKYKQNCSIQNL